MAANTVLINESLYPVNSSGSFVVITTDVNGVSTLPQTVNNGQQWNVVSYPQGNSMETGSAWSRPDEFAILNMDKANITINVYQGGNLLYTKTGVPYYVTAVFYFSTVPAVAAL
jgi:hypothetical protein